MRLWKKICVHFVYFNCINCSYFVSDVVFYVLHYAKLCLIFHAKCENWNIGDCVPMGSTLRLLSSPAVGSIWLTLGSVGALTLPLAITWISNKRLCTYSHPDCCRTTEDDHKKLSLACSSWMTTLYINNSLCIHGGTDSHQIGIQQ